MPHAALGDALHYWLSPRSRELKSIRKSWTTYSGAAIAVEGQYALKLQAYSLPRPMRLKQALLEHGSMARLPRERRAIIDVVWLDQRSARISKARNERRMEPALLMRRLDRDDLASRIERDPLEANFLAADFGSLLAYFHQRSHKVKRPPLRSESESLSSLETRLIEFAPQLDLAPPSWDAVRATIDAARAWLNADPTLLHERSRQGWRRDGHGDLHSENLHFLRGKATLLDILPIESYRIDDIASDLGRLAFEFHRLAGADARERVLQVYFENLSGVPSDLINYYEAKSLLIDLAVLAKNRAVGKPWPLRSTALLTSVETVCDRIIHLRR